MPFQVSIKDLVDILLVSLLMYEGFRLLKRSGAVTLFWGLVAFALAWWLVVYVLQLELTGAILDRVMSVAAIALIVIFQEEIRTFFYRLGTRVTWLDFHSLFRKRRRAESDQMVSELIVACQHMSDTKTGALIVLSGSQSLDEFVATGEKIDANTSARLIENIFFKNTPLHDGALIISNLRLQAAACILPVSKNLSIPQHYGLRHRAALGIAERTDAFAIIVSEETGRISIAQGDTIRVVQTDELETILLNL